MIPFLTKKPTNPQNRKVFVFLEIGDSNCLGAADAPVDAKYIGAIEKALIFKKNDLTSTNNGQIANVHHGVNNNCGFTQPVSGNYGDTSSLGYNLKERFKHLGQVCIVKLGVPASSLIYKVGTNLSWKETTGTLWQIYKDHFYTRAIEKLTQENRIVIHKGAFVRLGTNDLFVGGYTLTEFRTEAFNIIENIRFMTGDLNLPIYWCMVRPDLSGAGATNRDEIRQLIINMSTVGHIHYVYNFFAVDLGSNPADVFDGVHFTPTAYEAQGLMKSTLVNL